MQPTTFPMCQILSPVGEMSILGFNMAQEDFFTTEENTSKLFFLKAFNAKISLISPFL